jgi:hypothetical protein
MTLQTIRWEPIRRESGRIGQNKDSSARRVTLFGHGTDGVALKEPGPETCLDHWTLLCKNGQWILACAAQHAVWSGRNRC